MKLYLERKYSSEEVEVEEVKVCLGEVVFMEMYDDLTETLGKTGALDALAILDEAGVIVGD